MNPKGGLKLTGKFGPLGVAYLSAVDETETDDAWFNIARLRRDFGSNSIAGVTFTNRDAENNHNRVLAGDFRYVYGLYYIQAQLGGSYTSDLAGSRTAPIWQAEWDRTGRTWGFNYLLKGIGDGFDDQAGFVNRLRSNVVNGHFFNRLTHYGARGALLENLTVFFGPDRTWDYDGFGLRPGIEGFDQFDATFQLRGGWELNGHIQRDFVDFQDSTYSGYTSRRRRRPGLPAAGRLLGLHLVRQGDDADVEEVRCVRPVPPGTHADLPGGHHRRRLAASRARWTCGLSRRCAWRSRARCSGSTGSTAASSRGRRFPRLKVEYQPTRALFFRVIGEYRSESTAALVDPLTGAPLFIDGVAQPATEYNGLRVDLLASYEPTPGTVAFLGYGSTMETEDEFDWGGLERVNDGFFVKLAYQIRR